LMRIFCKSPISGLLSGVERVIVGNYMYMPPFTCSVLPVT